MNILVFLIIMSVFGAWLIRLAARDDLWPTASGSAVRREHLPDHDGALPGGEPDEVEGTTWSALDDHQLTRLLKGSPGAQGS